MRYHVSVPVTLDRQLGGRKVVRDIEPGEFTARTPDDKAIAAYLVRKGLAEPVTTRTATNHEKEA